MNADARKLTITKQSCGTCGTGTTRVVHQTFPELQISGRIAEQAVAQLAGRLTVAMDVVADPHREPLRQAIADTRAFLDRQGAAHCD